MYSSIRRCCLNQLLIGVGAESIFVSSCFSRLFFFPPSWPSRSGVKSCISTTSDSMSLPAHHRLVGAAEPLSGWRTPASDERLACDSAPPLPKAVKDAWLGFLQTRKTAMPSLRFCMCSGACTYWLRCAQQQLEVHCLTANLSNWAIIVPRRTGTVLLAGVYAACRRRL